MASLKEEGYEHISAVYQTAADEIKVWRFKRSVAADICSYSCFNCFDLVCKTCAAQ